MFKKKERETATLLDIQINDKLLEFYEAWRELAKAVEKSIVKKNVVDLYPEGADKNKAAKDFEATQKSLICKIGAFDCRRQEYLDLVKKDGERITTVYYTNELLESHKVVEDCCEKFYKNS